MSTNFHDDLHGELTSVGITGALRNRILAEFDDHLAVDPEADLGAPPALARQFANELGTSRARRAAYPPSAPWPWPADSWPRSSSPRPIATSLALRRSAAHSARWLLSFSR
jgi:hypothetical protein